MDKNNLSDCVVEYILTLDLKGFKHISVNTIADQFQVNRCYLSQRFKDDKNYALNDYIVMVKVLRATALLAADEELTIDDLARMLGYSNTQYFCRLFKERIGTTPTKYKGYIRKLKKNKQSQP